VGASWVREHILDAHRAAPLHVVVVWEPMYPGDTRQDAVEDDVFDDPRVTTFRDPHEISGRWFGKRAEGGSEALIVWDAFYAFAPSAKWADPPTDVVAAGGPIIGGVDSLERDFVPLLRKHGSEGR
jgi:hypothetical protein